MSQQDPRAELPTSSRPWLPVGYGIDTSSEGLMAWEPVEEQLTAARNYWVGTTRPDGRPHVAPVWGLWMASTFYFGTDRASRKGRNLAISPNVVIHLESGDDVVILEGAVEEVTDETVRARVYEAYRAKYGMAPEGPEGSDSLLFGLRPRTAHSWRERDFPTSATRWRFPGAS